MVGGHSLITYAKKEKKKKKKITFPLCEYSTVHFGIYTPSLSPYTCTHKIVHCEKMKIKYTSIFYLYVIKILYKGLDPYDTCQQCIAYILKTTSRCQLVHMSKRSTELNVSCYCVSVEKIATNLNCLRNRGVYVTCAPYKFVQFRLHPSSLYACVRIS